MKPHRSKQFLGWAKRQGGECCVCKDEPSCDLHHLDGGTTGRKGSDFMVARVCRKCHGEIQGKRFIAFSRENRLDIWCGLLWDALQLLGTYASNLENPAKEWIENDNPIS